VGSSPLSPLFGILKNVLFPGSGQVSVVWAVERQLFERGSSGSPLRPDSRAYMAVADWL
jgi:hypothetical protein